MNPLDHPFATYAEAASVARDIAKQHGESVTLVRDDAGWWRLSAPERTATAIAKKAARLISEAFRDAIEDPSWMRDVEIDNHDYEELAVSAEAEAVRREIGLDSDADDYARSEEDGWYDDGSDGSGAFADPNAAHDETPTCGDVPTDVISRKTNLPLVGTEDDEVPF